LGTSDDIPQLHIADWRRRVVALYGQVRGMQEPAQAWRHWCAARNRLFREHPASPLPPTARTGFTGLAYYPYDPDLRLTVALKPLEGVDAFAVDLGADGRLDLRPLAQTDGLDGRLGGELTVYWLEAYGGGLFLPFRDASSGSTTYGGGRYLLDSIKGADLGMDGEALVLDFNFAYYPSCACAPAWTCPLAPPENRLPVPVHAGERDGA